MQHAFITELDTLAIAIKQGQSNSPPPIKRYFQLAKAYANGQSEADKKIIYLRTFTTLLDTICDTYIDYHWRCICLDHIYEPLFWIQRLAKTAADKRQVRQLYYELATFSQFFL